jgi:hypothetical protein
MIEPYLNRLASQFKDSSNLKELLTSHLLEYDSNSISLDDVLQNRGLETAIGVQLDGIGELVDFKRPFASSDVLGAFGFDLDNTSLGFTDLNDPTLGGNFVTLGQTEQPIGDDLYRILLKAKIQSNKTKMTAEDVIKTLSFALDNANVVYTVPVNTQPNYSLGKILNTFEIQVVLPLIPVMIGIEKNYFNVMYNPNPFGFAGDNETLGFGDLTDTSLGGNFATFVN